jgi:hypothetical protein
MFKKLILLGFLGIVPVCVQAQNIGIINPQTNASALTTGTLAASRGGTGEAGTFTGARKANGASADTAAACADLSNGTTNCSAAVGQLPGTATNDSANAGNVGELISNTAALGGTSVISTTPLNITSISLTAGNWDVSGVVYYSPATSTNYTILQASTNTTTATIDATPGNFGEVSTAGLTDPSNVISVSTGIKNYSFASTTTVFLTAEAVFTVSTMAAGGGIRARRVR